LLPGRWVLANSVLNAIPLHYMQTFLLPKWVLWQLTQITRRFLWRGNKDSFSGGRCLVSWPKLTLPKSNGGIGTFYLSLQNKSLLVKWIWLAKTDKNCLWAHTLQSLHISIKDLDEADPSFFTKDLHTLMPYYAPSVQTDQDGTLSWRWGPSFTVQSLYRAYNNPGIIQTKLASI
jgi:hypothetical protein